MASKSSKSAAPAQVQNFLRGQIHDAQKAFTSLETEAEKVFQRIVARAGESRRELDTLVAKLNGRELKLLESRQVKALSKRATEAGNEVKKRLDGLQNRVVEAVGVASQTQVKEINRELSRLSKKLDQVLGASGGGKKAASRTRTKVAAKANGGQKAEPRA